MSEDEGLLVTFQRLVDVATTLRQTTEASRAVNLARIQQLEHYFAVSQALLPPVHEQATHYLRVIRERYLTLLASYDDIATQLGATAQHAESFHTKAVHSLGDVHDQS